MQVKNIAIAAVIASAFAGNAFAFQPASGEAPFFQNEAVATSTQTRQTVSQEAAANPPATNADYARAAFKSQDSSVTREDVRASAREAIAQGFRIKTGEMS